MDVDLKQKHDYGAYRPWFLGAAVYNAIWGSIVVLAPRAVLDFVGLEDVDALPLWQAIGMTVLVFAPAYWWASRDPWAHRHLILIATASKVMGLIGFVVAAVAGQLPWSFGIITIGNDIIWLPAFLAFGFSVARERGWRALLMGE